MAQAEKLTRRLEDYLEAVLMLAAQRQFARVRDIAAATGVSMSSVTAALKKLARDGLVHYQAYEWVTLTPRGRQLASGVQSKHDALEEFLTEVLAVDAPTARANACRMEHVVDGPVLRRMSLLAQFLRQHAGHELLAEFQTYCRRPGRRDSRSMGVPPMRRRAVSALPSTGETPVRGDPKRDVSRLGTPRMGKMPMLQISRPGRRRSHP